MFIPLWGRGSNENAKGFLGENFLKKPDLARVSDKEIHEAPSTMKRFRLENCMGHLPMK